MTTFIITTSGIKKFLFEDKLHREDGPAVIYPSGREEYFRHGKHHNVNGHAVIYQNGTTEYYFEGEIISKKILDNFLKIKTKRQKNLQKLYLRIWYDQTYQDHADAFLSRMLRDMDHLENIVGYNFPD